MEHVQQNWPHTQMIFLGEPPSNELIEVNNMGSFHCLKKPYEIEHLIEIINKAVVDVRNRRSKTNCSEGPRGG